MKKQIFKHTASKYGVKNCKQHWLVTMFRSQDFWGGMLGTELAAFLEHVHSVCSTHSRELLKSRHLCPVNLTNLPETPPGAACQSHARPRNQTRLGSLAMALMTPPCPATHVPVCVWTAFLPFLWQTRYLSPLDLWPGCAPASVSTGFLTWAP